MTIVDEIIEELRKGTSLKAIQARYGTGGRMVEAYRQYIPELEGVTQEKRSQLSPLNSRFNELDALVKFLETREKQLNDSIGSLEEEEKSARARHQQELDKLEEATKNKGKELEEINSKLSDLSKRGVTIELVERIHSMQVESGKDLLDRVETLANYEETKKGLSKMRAEMTPLQKGITGSTKTLEGLRADIQTEKNTFDEWQSKTRAFREAIKITGWFFSEGYKTADLKSIKDGIELVGIKGDPTLSIDRLALSTEPQEMKLIAKSDMEFLLTRMIEWYRLYGKIFPRVKLLDLDPSPSVGFKQLRFGDTIGWSLTILRITI